MEAYNKVDSEIETYGNSLIPFIERAQGFQARLACLSFLQKMVLFLPHIYVLYCASEGIIVWRTNKPVPNLTELLDCNSFFKSLKKAVVTPREKISTLFKEMTEMNSDLKSSVKSSPNDVSLVSKTSFDFCIELKNVDLYAGNNLIQENQCHRIDKGE